MIITFQSGETVQIGPAQLLHVYPFSTHPPIAASWRTPWASGWFGLN